MFWNANGVLNDQHLYSELFAEHKIDIALINESHLQPTNKWSIQAYVMYRTEGHRPHMAGQP
jgi:hypothetical protein